jgi:hypothetical protein
MDDKLSVAATARWLGISLATISEMLRFGPLCNYGTPGRPLIDIEELGLLAMSRSRRGDGAARGPRRWPLSRSRAFSCSAPLLWHRDASFSATPFGLG